MKIMYFLVGVIVIATAIGTMLLRRHRSLYLEVLRSLDSRGFTVEEYRPTSINQQGPSAYMLKMRNLQSNHAADLTTKERSDLKKSAACYHGQVGAIVVVTVAVFMLWSKCLDA